MEANLIPLQRFALVIAYDGTEFLGWQKTLTGRSVEEYLTAAVERITGTKTSLEAASRTDAGVHAEGQVVAFNAVDRYSELSRWKKGLNALLPSDLRVLEVMRVPIDFHPTLSSIWKEYHYTLCYDEDLLPWLRCTVWHTPGKLDLTAMRQAIGPLLGRHRFAAFANRRKQQDIEDDERNLYEIEIIETCPGHLLFRVRGDHFLYKMVRNLVGLLVSIGRGNFLPSEVPSILAQRDRCHPGLTAAAEGLVLKQIKYNEEMNIRHGSKTCLLE